MFSGGLASGLRATNDLSYNKPAEFDASANRWSLGLSADPITFLGRDLTDPKAKSERALGHFVFHCEAIRLNPHQVEGVASESSESVDRVTYANPIGCPQHVGELSKGLIGQLSQRQGVVIFLVA